MAQSNNTTSNVSEASEIVKLRAQNKILNEIIVTLKKHNSTQKQEINELHDTIKILTAKLDKQDKIIKENITNIDDKKDDNIGNMVNIKEKDNGHSSSIDIDGNVIQFKDLAKYLRTVAKDSKQRIWKHAVRHSETTKDKAQIVNLICAAIIIYSKVYPCTEPHIQ